MNLDELRDAHAKRLGWKYEEPFTGSDSLPWYNFKQDVGSISHPIPATLDAIAGLMPPNVRTFKDMPTRDGGPVCYNAVDSGHLIIATVPDTGDELTDRARLAWLAWEAEAKGAK